MDSSLGQLACPSASIPSTVWQRGLAQLRIWRRNWRTRRQLASLDARQLADAGISAAERQMELSKPFWR